MAVDAQASRIAVMQSQIWKIEKTARIIRQTFVRMTFLTVGSFQTISPKTIQARVLKIHQMAAGKTPSVLASVAEFISDPAPAQDAAIDSE